MITYVDVMIDNTDAYRDGVYGAIYRHTSGGTAYVYDDINDVCDAAVKCLDTIDKQSNTK